MLCKLFAESRYKEAGRLVPEGARKGTKPASAQLVCQLPLSSMGKDQFAVGPRILLLLLFLIPGEASTSTPEPQYLVLVPFLIHAETSEKICVHLSHLNESVSLSITLEYEGQNRSLIDNVLAEKDFFGCIPFTVPRWNGSSVVLLRVVVKGPTHEFRSQKTVLVKNLESLAFVQTDKPIYKPGQKVLFRIISLNEDFLPLNEKFPLVYIEDPYENRLIQWQDVQLQNGFTRLSFPLTFEPIHGTYKVVVQKRSGNNIEHRFEVKERELPKYEVSVKLPRIITIYTEELKVTACGTYTYGKPVPGLVKVRVCRKYAESRSQCSRRMPEAICEDFSGETDAHGCLTRVVKTNIFELKRKGYDMSIRVTAQLIEEGTGLELIGFSYTEITSTLSKVTFEEMDTYYKPGLPLFVRVKLVDSIGVPMANETIQIRIAMPPYSASYKTDGHGKARFFINTDNFTEQSIHVEALYKSPDDCFDMSWVTPSHQSATKTAFYHYSPSKSYIHIDSVPETLSCGHIQPLKVRYILNLDAVAEKIHFYYLVMAKGGIVESGIHAEPVENGKAKGMFLLDLSVDIKTAPVLNLFLYVILPSGELVADTIEFAVENCFSNKVKLSFSAAEGLPNSKTQLHLAAYKDSLCAIRAVDKSVLKPEAELSPRTVYNLLPVKNLRGYSYQNHRLDEPNMEQCVTPKHTIVDGIHYSPFSHGKGDPYELMKNFGLKVFTNVKIHQPEFCNTVLNRGGVPGFRSVRMSYEHPASPVVRAGAPMDRTLSPETWLWLEASVNSDGQADVPVTIPDTITEWNAGAFCTSAEAGFGLSQTVSIKTSQPFFLEVSLPYSVVRGEAFVLKATVFTYLQHCIRVAISLAPSVDFVASPLENEEESYCLCMSERQMVSWTVTPKSLGEVNVTVSAESIKSEKLCGNEIVKIPSEGQTDTVIKSFLVEPEGVENEVVFNNVICGTGDSEAPVSLTVPENVVEGSARAYFCVLGDILGTALQNLQQLLRLPYGCGEQNMVLFAPNIYILDYLNKTEQLTEETRSKAIGYLVAGYQRQLKYKHTDGSYSTFGLRHHVQGNTWLTAFVLKSFAQARSYIFVEDQLITDAQASLVSRQKENGCFQSSEHLLNNAIKGGVDDEVTLSAYITIALLEIPLPVSHPVVRNALFCLETAAQAEDIHVYTRALLAYAFALAGKEEKKKEMLSSLEEAAVKEGDGSMHWQKPGRQQKEPNQPFYEPPASSAEVEMTGYVLLAHLTEKPVLSKEALTTASKIVKWLSKQQNPTGGFSSAQDTVVALQALSLYGASTYSKTDAQAEAKLLSGKEVQHQFQVDKHNRLLLQCGAVAKVPGDYSVQVTGEGCVYAQTTLKYNVQPRHEGETFALEVHTVPETCTGPKANVVFDVVINVSYTGKRPTPNVAIIDVKMLSGFIPVKSSVRKLEMPRMIKRTEESRGDRVIEYIELHERDVKQTEVSTNHVLLYLKQMSNVTQSYSFTVEREAPVQDLKPALVKVYDYYETDDFVVAEYNTPCSTGEIKQKTA
ncbi:alpha-2-macroglobulin-like [Eublepharis macularius]|uniref:Alpha-2-macroglobulin-like n=1 Tax=Eublepharis macularius TaxID=481883 RepID=A0AA97KMZ7_EUBMA|nr:alpha-2-macroglobulin-like [Eublepharis macularius]